MMAVPLRVKRLPHAIEIGLPLPAYAKEGDVGLDLRACWRLGQKIKFLRVYEEGRQVEFDVREGDYFHLEPKERVWIPTGIAVEIPDGYEITVRGRSGFAFNHFVHCGHFGTIDSGYRGEVLVELVNDGDEMLAIVRGDRIAQMVVSPIARCSVMEVNELSESPRSSSGFGSSGKG